MWRWALTAVCLLAVAGAQAVPAWTRAGPAGVETGSGTPLGGPLAALATDAEGNLYAGGLGGVWHYSDNLWTDLTSGEPIPVSALAVSADHSAIYAGGGYWGGGDFAANSRAGSGVLYSSDGGVSWSVRGAAALAGLLVSRLWLDPADSQHLLAATVVAADSSSGTEAGLWESHDGGVSWTNLIAGNVWDVCWNNGNILAAAAAGLEFSAAGMPLQPVSGASGYGRATLTADGTGFLALLAGGAQLALITVTSNGIATASASLPASDVNFSQGGAVAVAVDASGAIYAAGAELWQLTGSGAWATVTTGMPATQLRSLLPGGGGAMWVASDSGLWQETAGSGFASLNLGLTNFGVSAMALNPDGSITAALASGAVATGASPTATWTLASGNPSVPPNADPALDSLSGLQAQIMPGGVELSLDGGNTWQPLSGLPPVPVAALAFDGQQTLWAATLGAGVWSFPLASAGKTLTLSAPGQATVGSQVDVTATEMQLGQPAGNAVVTFTEGAWSQSAVTGSDGTAAVKAPAPKQAGAYSIVASTGADLEATASVVALPGPQTQLQIASGQDQPAQTVGEVLQHPLVVEAEDSFGNPVAGVVVSFAASAGSLSAAEIATDASGLAAVRLTLPATAAVVTVTASAAADKPLTFTATAAAPPGFTLLLSPSSLSAGPNQTANFAVTVLATGGFNQPVTLLCAQPATACSVAPASITPGETATVSVSSSAVDAAAGGTLAVQVEGTAAGMPPQIAKATVALESLTLTAASANVSLTAGGSAAAVPLTIGAVNGLTGQVTLSATLDDGGPLPSSLLATFEPNATPTLAGSAATSTLQLAVTSGSGAPPPPGWPPWMDMAGLSLAAALAGCVRLRRRTRRRRLAWLLGGLL
ncbi:MAG: WD40/YVTN/BNR-like repeat-containing protein, partial [Terriglobales bacterium]